MDCIKVYHDGCFSVLDVDLDCYVDICQALGCSDLEIVRTPELRHAFNDNVVMVIGGCSAIDGSSYNYFASEFYSGFGIFGDVIFCREVGPELDSLVNVDLIACWLENQIGLKRVEEI